MILFGDKIYLKNIELSDTDDIIRWRNQENVRKYFINQDLFTRESHLKWMENVVSIGKAVQFIVVVKSTKTPIGSVYIRDIDYKNKKGEFGIFIGEKQYTGHGFGTEAADLIIKYGFLQLDLNKIYLRVLSTNLSAIKSYLKVGFKYEGYFREDVYVRQNYLDVIFMGILKDEEKYKIDHINIKNNYL